MQVHKVMNQPRHVYIHWSISLQKDGNADTCYSIHDLKDILLGDIWPSLTGFHSC